MASKAPIDPREALNRLYASNPNVRALLSVLLRHHNSSTTQPSEISHIIASLRAEERLVVSRRKLVATLKAMDVTGCGRFRTGRRGLPSRFEWTPAAVSLARGVAEAGQTNAPTAATNLISHPYRLRRSLTVSVSLPEDLTEREANRLADFIRTLAFDV